MADIFDQTPLISDPINGNDYKIVSIKELNDEIALIQYNQGLSEAEVFLHEINYSN